MSLCERLRRAISGEHASIEATPIAVAMMRGAIDPVTYADLLAQLHPVHAAFERHLDRLPALGLPADGFVRTPAIEADLDALGMIAAPAGVEAAALADALDRWADAPAKLLGAAYVLEGSRMGGLVLARGLAAALGVPARPGHGLDYHLDGAADRPAAWKRIKAAMDALPLTPGEQDEAAAAAADLMALLRALYAAVSLEPAAA